MINDKGKRKEKKRKKTRLLVSCMNTISQQLSKEITSAQEVLRRDLLHRFGLMAIMCISLSTSINFWGICLVGFSSWLSYVTGVLVGFSFSFLLFYFVGLPKNTNLFNCFKEKLHFCMTPLILQFSSQTIKICLLAPELRSHC